MYKRADDIDAEYGSFDRQYKQSKSYNIKNYLHDKHRIRKASGLDSIAEDIAEVIGESSGSAAQVSFSNS